MTVRYLGLGDFAKRIGVSEGTLRGYSAKGLLPAPDVLVGLSERAVRGWLPETIDRWQASRPGRGARTDLKKN